jgi:hypothetical protein
MSFSGDIKKFNEKTEKAATNIFRGTALSLFGRIVYRTPVGNTSLWKTKYPPKGYVGGRLRGGWQAQLNSSPSSIKDKIDSGGSGTVSDASSVSGRAKLGDSIFFVNNLPYAKAIEDGHSKNQAPAGMVKVTILEFKRIVNQQARKNR